MVDWVIRDPEMKPDDYTLEKWSAQKLRFHVGGLRIRAQQHVNWASGELSAGDEVTIRVLGPGEFDEPAHEGDEPA